MGREQREKQGPKTAAILEAAGLKESAPAGNPMTYGLVNAVPTEYDVVVHSGMNTQAEIRKLNDLAKQGFEHYFTLSLYGSTEKMYFRKYS